MRTFTTTRGDTFSTHLTDGEALDIVARLRGDFARSLVTQFQGRGLSPRQLPWLHKLALDEHNRTAAPAQQPSANVARYGGIVALMQRAAAHLQRPRIRFSMPEGNVQLSIAGSASRYSGQVMVTDGGAYGSNAYYGRIDADGVFGNVRACPQWVIDALASIDANPAQFAGAYGQRVGACCFCSRELTTAESLAVGYGPICAEHYGLPWGTQRAETSPAAIVAGMLAGAA